MDLQQKEELKELLQRFANKCEYVFKETSIELDFLEDEENLEIFAVLTKETERDFDYYEKNSGNILTVTLSGKEKEFPITVSSEGVDKRVIRSLRKTYHCEGAEWSYDQISPPCWEYTFVCRSLEEVQRLLEEMQTSSNQYPTTFASKRETEPLFVFGFGKDVLVKGEKKEHLKISIMEKEDWLHFKEVVFEHYHDEFMKPIKEAMDMFGLKRYGSGKFGFYIENTNQEQVKQQLESHPNFEFSEDFQVHINQ